MPFANPLAFTDTFAAALPVIWEPLGLERVAVSHVWPITSGTAPTVAVWIGEAGVKPSCTNCVVGCTPPPTKLKLKLVGKNVTIWLFVTTIVTLTVNWATPGVVEVTAI